MDGLELSTHMVDAGVGVATLQTYELKRIDEDYFAEVE
jgi:restriction endonuclease Mrr